MSNNVNATSSIDASWPPVSGSNERIRGFYNQLLIDSSIGEFEYAYEAAFATVSESSHASRATLRAVGRATMIPELENRGIQVEAAMPLFGSYEDLHLIYTGFNTPSRKPEGDTLEKHRSVMDQARNQYPANNYPQTTRPLPPELSAEVYHSGAKSMDPATFNGLLELYGAFDMDESQVEEIVDNPDNTIALLKTVEGAVVTTALAERATIPIEGQNDLIIAEITEAATLPERRGEGLYTFLSRFLVRQVAADPSFQLNALYGESNLSSVGVIYAAAKNGRSFSYHDRESVGSTNNNFGILLQNFKVLDGVDERPYNDFALSYHRLR